MLFDNINKIPLLIYTLYNVDFYITIIVNLYLIALEYYFLLFYNLINIFNSLF
jgi:hypothetical protein